MTDEAGNAISAIVAEAADFQSEPPAPLDLQDAGISRRDALLSVCDPAVIWRTPDGETYATVNVAGHQEHLALQGRDFRDWMIGQLARTYTYRGRPASASESAIRDARMALEARAVHSSLRRDAFPRVASHDGRIYLDLGQADWSAVEVSSDGWRLVDAAPIPILRSRRTGAFPWPQRGDGFAALRQLLEVLTEDDFVLFVSWCIGALMPTGPYPILIVGGEQGSGKSTLARLAQRLTDPVVGDLLQPPRDDRDLIAAARNNRVLAFDNFSGIGTDLADSICRLATGSEIGGRALFTNHDTASFSACRPLVLNGIPDLASRGDLADRAIALRLDPPRNRTTERQWKERVDALLPAILASFLDAVTTSLRNLGETSTPDTRMADFAQFVVAAESALPWVAGTFLQAYRRNRGEVVAMLAEGDVVAATLRTFISERGEPWHGLVSSLYQTLSALALLETRRSEWPGNARWFSDRLRRASPALRALGIDVRERRSGEGVKVSISQIAPLATLGAWRDGEADTPGDANVASDASPLLSDSPVASLPAPEEDVQADFEERAAILEYDAGLARPAAEALAARPFREPA